MRDLLKNTTSYFSSTGRIQAKEKDLSHTAFEIFGKREVTPDGKTHPIKFSEVVADISGKQVQLKVDPVGMIFQTVLGYLQLE